MADETDPNNPPQEVVPQPPDPPPSIEVQPDTLLLARAMVFSGVAALHPGWSEKDVAAKAVEVVATHLLVP